MINRVILCGICGFVMGAIVALVIRDTGLALLYVPPIVSLALWFGYNWV